MHLECDDIKWVLSLTVLYESITSCSCDSAKTFLDILVPLSLHLTNEGQAVHALVFLECLDLSGHCKQAWYENCSQKCLSCAPRYQVQLLTPPVRSPRGPTELNKEPHGRKLICRSSMIGHYSINGSVHLINRLWHHRLGLGYIRPSNIFHLHAVRLGSVF